MDNHGDKARKPNRNWYPCTVVKVPADSVAYGEQVSTNGRTVWVAMEGERVVCIASSAEEVRRKYRKIKTRIRVGEVKS